MIKKYLSFILYMFCYLSLIIFSALLFLYYAADVSAATITLTPSEDSYVSSRYGRSNYGDEITLIASDYSSNVRTAYLKFKLPQNSQILNAQLRLTTALNRQIEKTLYSTDTDWSEETLNYSNRPSSLFEIGYYQHLDSRLQVGEVVSVELDVSNINPDSDGYISVTVENAGSGNTFEFYSKESDMPPKLVVETGEVVNSPTPSSSSLDGDANGDGIVDDDDYLIWLSNYNNSTTNGAASGDFDDNGNVDGVDYMIWRNNYGESVEPSATPTANNTPTTTSVNTPTPTPTNTGSAEIWISPEEISNLPTSGSSWDALLKHADSSYSGSANSLSERDQDNTITLAKAFVYARIGDSNYRIQVKDALQRAMNTEAGNDMLAVLRNTYAYVVAADLIDLQSYDSAFDSNFRNWLTTMRTNDSSCCGGCSNIIDCHERRPNNFGTHAAASRIAIAVYLDDQKDLQRAVNVHRGWLGERDRYAGFSFGELSWQCDQDNPVGINVRSCTIDGYDIDGVLPDDQRRSGSFSWPPACENYVWEALQGSTVANQILYRAGYTSAWEWSDKAFLRAFEWLHSVNGANWCSATGDDTWIPYLINDVYGTNYPASSSVGKGFGFTDWTHK